MIFRTDQGSEFNNEGLKARMKAHGAELRMHAPYVKDPIAEATIKQIVSHTLACLLDANLRQSFWSVIMEAAIHVSNRAWNNNANHGKGEIPYRLLRSVKPNVSYFRMLGCPSLVVLEQKKKLKVSPRSKMMIFVGYDTEKRTWLFLDPVKGTIQPSVSAAFFER